jgi:Cys-tRNA(Pro)/Cys-tRNA(Cys) deacylase
MAKSIKTNGLRLLERAGIPHVVHSYVISDNQNDGISVARKINMEPFRVFKTLVTQAAPKEYHVFIIPVALELDLKKAAQAAGVKKIDLIPVKNLLGVTGYIKGGCSPVGMKKSFPSYFDQGAEGCETIIVSAGKVGWQVELSPRDLVDFIGASFQNLTKSPS